VGPAGPCWFQSSAVSVPVQVCAGVASASMIRMAPFEVVTHEWMVPSADGMAATPTAAPAPSAATVGSAIRSARLENVSRMTGR